VDTPQPKPQVLKGMRDMLPPRMLLRQHVIGTLKSVFERFGFEPLETPAIEYAETLEGKFGEDERLIYKFEDRGGRRVALRYDLTVPLARVVAMYKSELVMPFKRYQIAPVWRADKPQKGRYREFWQCDADIVGSSSMLADAETVAVFYTGLRALGFTRFTTLLNNRKVLLGLASWSGVPAEQASLIHRAIDKLAKIGPEGVRDEMLASGVPIASADRLIDLVTTGPGEGIQLVDARDKLRGFPDAQLGIDELIEIDQHLRDLGIPSQFYRFDLSLARGLDYYTGPIFETLVEEPRIGSITGGGRYDNMLALFGEKPMPMTGGSFGLERIIDVIEELEIAAVKPTVTDVMVTVFGGDTVSLSLRVATHLREKGIRAEVNLDTNEGLGKQLRYASRKGIPLAVIAGPDEASRGELTLRDMVTGEQRSVRDADLLDAVREKMKA
jgi:histidyl-tRNA synthetase